MKRQLAIAIMLASCSDACAVVQIFFTNSASGYGLTDPARAFQPTAFAQTDAASYQVVAFPPLDAWGQIPAIDYPGGQFAYIWARFSGEPNNRKIARLHLDLDEVPAEVAYYIMDDIGGSNGLKRWDGAYEPPNALEFRQDPQILAAVSSNGIKNASNASQSWNLYDHLTRTALLGAVRYYTPGIRSATLGQLGLSFGGFTQGIAEFGSAFWGPEPGALLLLATTALLVRRR